MIYAIKCSTHEQVITDDTKLTDWSQIPSDDNVLVLALIIATTST